MNFCFNIRKATEAASLLLERAGGRMSILKLVKLIYLVDRLSLERRNVPIVGGDYLSMRNGPVTSELLDLINAGKLLGEEDDRWEKSITNRVEHQVELQETGVRENLSDTELGLLDEIWRKHGQKDQWELVNWCHAHCNEWFPITRGCAPISVERIGMALSMSGDRIHRLSKEAVELNMLDDIFSK
jgi:uncharacterized phage-associated protein